jgi:uroporphyrinogen-III synthase
MSDAGLKGLIVLAFESRRATEMAELIRRHGGTPVVAPSMREVPIEENTAAFAFLESLEAGRIDVVILLTGVGTRTLAEVLAGRCPHQRFAALLRRCTLIARGPKPVAALRELGLSPQVTVPEPNTWRDLLAALDASVPVEGRRVAVQEYGITNPDLLEGLRARGAEVLQVPVYRWALPEDLEPLRRGVRRLAQRAVDVAVFTSATQVHHMMRLAGELGLQHTLVSAADAVVFASIGPVCSEALREHCLPVDLEPAHPKMGHLLATVARDARRVLARKRTG